MVSFGTYDDLCIPMVPGVFDVEDGLFPPRAFRFFFCLILFLFGACSFKY